MTPTYGMLHYFVDAEDMPGGNGSPERYFTGGIIPTKDPRIPNLGWANYLGRMFAKAVNPVAIADAGFAIEKIGDGYLIQVTDRLRDVEDNYSYFSERRLELKRLFPDNFFLIKNEPISG